jgi:hypothetical protein
MKQYLPAGHAGTEQRAQQDDAVMRGLAAVRDVQQKTECDHGERHALQQAQRTRKLALRELERVGGKLDGGDTHRPRRFSTATNSLRRGMIRGPTAMGR